MPSQQCRRATNGRGDLKNFRVKQDARIAPGCLRANEVDAHRAGGRFEFDDFVVFDGHGGWRLEEQLRQAKQKRADVSVSALD